MRPTFKAQLRQQLEGEQEHRAAKLRELKQAIADLEAEESASVGRRLRAEKLPADQRICPRCWIWDGAQVSIEAIPSSPDAPDIDLFRCRSCGHEFESLP
jgi:hypothetical protein